VIKTLHITNYWHDASGGIRTWYRSVLEVANRERRLTRLVVPGPETRLETVGDYGLIYHVRSRMRAPFDRRYRVLLPHRYMLPVGEVRRVLGIERPDLVEVCDRFSLNWLPGLIRKGRYSRLGRPVLIGLACERLDDSIRALLGSSALAGRLAAAYCRWCYVPMFDAHLAVSDYVRRELEDAMHPRHRRPVEVASPGVDVSVFRPAVRSESERRRLLSGGSGGDLTALMVYAGRLSPEKNVGLLLEVVDRLHADGGATDYRLLIAGSGRLQDWLCQEARARPAGRVQMLGQIGPPGDLAQLYANCDVFLHPNAREPFGIGPLEAMATGCPVVLPSSGGVLTYANQDNAWLANPTSEGFAEAIRALTRDVAGRRERCRRGRSTAAENSRTEAVIRAFRLYDSFHAASAPPKTSRVVVLGGHRRLAGASESSQM
jgi:alpha-1,6-mannosyltransferase